MYQPKIVAVCGWKYEPENLLLEWMENTAWVDDHVVIDCRERTDEAWIDEHILYTLERKEAIKKKADWVLVVSPDERLERKAEGIIRQAVLDQRKHRYRFHNRELFEPTAYRVDGTWGNLWQTRLYRVEKNQVFDKKKLHNNPCPTFPERKRYDLEINMYHQKHIEPENGRIRAELYKHLDPENQFNAYSNYDYLAERDGMQLQEIIPGREYHPPYKTKYLFQPPEKFYT